MDRGPYSGTNPSGTAARSRDAGNPPARRDTPFFVAAVVRRRPHTTRGLAAAVAPRALLLGLALGVLLGLLALGGLLRRLLGRGRPRTRHGARTRAGLRTRHGTTGTKARAGFSTRIGPRTRTGTGLRTSSETRARLRTGTGSRTRARVLLGSGPRRASPGSPAASRSRARTARRRCPRRAGQHDHPPVGDDLGQRHRLARVVGVDEEQQVQAVGADRRPGRSGRLPSPGSAVARVPALARRRRRARPRGSSPERRCSFGPGSEPVPSSKHESSR